MKLVTLVAGQSCAIRCEGKLRMKLYTGILDIAGAPLERGKVATFALRCSQPLVVYTLEGCVFGLQPECDGDSKLSTEISNVAVGGLLKHIKKGFDQPTSIVNAAGLVGSNSSGGLRIVVAGAKGSGKFMAACTIANALNRTRPDGIVFCDLTTGMDGQLSKLGCLGCIETHPEVPLWQGLQWSMYTSSIMFFHGLSSATVTASQLPQFLVSAGSACESASWMSQQKQEAPIVYVLPSYDASTISQEVFYHTLLEPIQPTHVVFTGDEDGNTHSTLGRLLPAAKIMYCGSVVTPSASQTHIGSSEQHQSSPADAALTEYFLGTALNPLGASLITVPLDSVQFVTVKSQQGRPVEVIPTVIGEEGSSNSATELIGTICAVAHASTASEVPFANTAGLVVIVNVLSETNELELLSPSSDAWVPSSFLVIPEDTTFRKVAVEKLLIF